MIQKSNTGIPGFCQNFIQILPLLCSKFAIKESMKDPPHLTLVFL